MSKDAAGTSYEVVPIGYVRRDDEDGIDLEVLRPYRTALKQLEHFSHVQVLWWCHYTDDPECRAVLENQPPYGDAPMTGVFASRSPVRPNPIGLTTAKVLGVDRERGRVHIADIDAADGTPIVDLKAYFPVCDRVKDATIPDYLSDWPEWMPEDGLSLEEYHEEGDG